MYYILHQHYESVLRLAKLLNPKKLENFYNIFNSKEFLKLEPQNRLRFLQKALPIPDETHFTLENFYKIAKQTVEEMVQYNIDYIDLRVSLLLERWKYVNGISHAKEIYNKALATHNNKKISFIAAIDLTKDEKEIKKSMNALFENKNIASITGIDITLYEDDVYKFEKYYKTLLQIRSEFNKKIIIHLGEFTTEKINLKVLKKLKPNRIVHGIALLESEIASKFIKDNDICLDICPVSNSILGVVDWNTSNPIKKALKSGISVTINTDDPIMFNTNINKEIKIANLNQKELKTLLKNSIKYAGKIY